MNRYLISPLKILLLGIFALFFGCTKDIYEDSIQPNQDYYVKTIDFDEFKKNCSGFQKYKGIEDVKERAKTSRVAIDSIYGFAVKTDEAKYIKDGDYDSYTFEIFWPGSDNKTLSNLLFSKNKDGGYDAYVVAYDFPKGALAGMTVEEITAKDAKFYYIDTESASERIPIEGCVFWYEQKCTPPRDGNNDGGSIDPECHWVRMQICGHQAGGDFPDGWNDDSGGSTPPGGNQGGNTSNPPSGSIGGNGTPTHITTPTICTGCPDFNDEDMHCNQLKFALERDATNSGLKPNIKKKLKDLKDAINQLQEHGFEMTKDTDGIYTNNDVPSTTAGPENGYSMGINWGMTPPEFYGCVHTHPTIAIEMFSFGDVYSLYEIYKRTRADLKQEAVIYLVCEDNNDVKHVYALKIDNFAVFEGFVLNAMAGTGLPSTAPVKKIIDKVDEELTADFYTLDTKPERAFLRFFKDAGISAYEADESINNWSKISLETPASPFTSNVKKTPCN